MSKLAQHVGTRSVNKVRPYVNQLQKYAPEQEKNSAGGYVYKVGNWDQLKRFLVLGTYGGTFYISEKSLTQVNYDAILGCVGEDGLRVVEEIVRVSENGLAPKNDFAVFALAVAAAFGNEETKRAAYQAVTKVCRTSTHLFQFLEDSSKFRGHGNGFNRAIRRWYTGKTVDEQAYQMVKYRNRNNWSHRKVLRLTRITPRTLEESALYHWAVNGTWNSELKMPMVIEGFEKSKTVESVEQLVDYIKQYNLTWEAVPNQYLKDKSVWEALLAKMPPTAMIRNLGNMSSAGVFDSNTNSDIVIQTLNDVSKLKKAKVHPMQMAVASIVYSSGRGDLGNNSWQVNPRIVDALDDAFMASMKAVEPTGLKMLVAVDESGSMAYHRSGIGSLKCSEVSGILALTHYCSEPNVDIISFDTSYRKLNMSKRMSLKEAMGIACNGGGTDLSLPIKYALDNNLMFDVFVVYTDNETYAGQRHVQALFDEYRKRINPKAKMLVASMAANAYSASDPNDPAILQVVGLDSSLPQVIAAFAKL